MRDILIGIIFLAMILGPAVVTVFQKFDSESDDH